MGSNRSRSSILKPTPSVLRRASALLRRGGLVAFPTETVYGLGAAALNPAAVAKIFRAKGRPSDNPLIVHLARPSQMSAVCARVPEAAWKLSRVFWPGPLTLVLPKHSSVPKKVTAGLTSVAVRVPAHPAALKLLKLFNGPVAAPSANRSGRPSPTSARHVEVDLGRKAGMILDGGECRHGLESTVLDLTRPVPAVLRLGAVSREAIERVIGPVRVYAGPAARAASPGLRHRHYAPRCGLRLFRSAHGEFPLEIAGKRAGILCLTRMKRPAWVSYFRRVPGGTAAYGRVLFAALREAEEAGVEVLYAEAVPASGLGAAVMDRLLRASAPSSRDDFKNGQVLMGRIYQ